MLRIRVIHEDALRTVSVVESVETRHGRTASCCQATGRLEPLAVIVSAADGEYAVDVNAEPIDAEHLSRMLASCHFPT